MCSAFVKLLGKPSSPNKGYNKGYIAMASGNPEMTPRIWRQIYFMLTGTDWNRSHSIRPWSLWWSRTFMGLAGRKCRGRMTTQLSIGLYNMHHGDQLCIWWPAIHRRQEQLEQELLYEQPRNWSVLAKRNILCCISPFLLSPANLCCAYYICSPR